MSGKGVRRVDLAEKLALFDERWSPRIVGELNGQHVKLAKLEGEFVRHAHAGEDELFLVVKGRLVLRWWDASRGNARELELAPGQLAIVPAGIEHQPLVPHGVCEVLLFEPASTLNTGDVRETRTVEDPEWI